MTPEERKQRQLEWSRKYHHSEKGRRKAEEYRLSHMQYYRDAKAKYRLTEHGKQKIKEYDSLRETKNRKNERRYSLRLKLVKLLGSMCAICGLDDVRTLEIDHINGYGRRERTEFGDWYKQLKYYLLNESIARERLQVLCGNCHNIKTYEEIRTRHALHPGGGICHSNM